MPDPQAAGGTIEELVPPPDMHPDAQEVWRIVTPDLVDAKVLRPSDLPLLGEFCESLALAARNRLMADAAEVRLVAAMEAGPDEGEGSKDFTARLDMWSQMQKRHRTAHLQYAKLAISLASEFGISPVARVRLGLAKIQGTSLLASLDRRMQGDADAGAS
jgi:phage terminase small subunit